MIARWTALIGLAMLRMVCGVVYLAGLVAVIVAAGYGL